MTAEQERALRNARDFLAGDGGTEQVVGDPDWHRACRLALRDIVAAFQEELS
jgi:hypothetical protein